jgi:PAS domain S-box-containing protein
MTNDLLHILLLEDDPADVEFIKTTMRRAGLVFETQVAADRKEFMDAILKNPFDIVLADNALPQFDSVEALALLQENQPGIPFILVTGTVSEEFAVYILQRGADDYILKKNIHRLPAAVTMAIDKRKIKTEKQKALDDLAFSESRYKLLFENSPMPMMLFLRSDYSIKAVNNAAVNHYGYSREEFLQMTAKDIRPDEDKKKFIIAVATEMTDGYSRNVWRHLKKNGELIDVEIHSHDHKFEDKPARLAVINDITEKLKIEKRLKETLEETRRLASNLQNIREEERASISRDIHDQLGQMLTALRLDLSHIKSKLNPEEKQIIEKITASVQTTNEIIATVRKISSNLRPALLDDMGLGAALEWQAREFRRTTGIPCHFTEDGSFKGIDISVATALFRLYQEALTNISRHANATRVQSFLKRKKNSIELHISDNGTGFDIKAARAKKTLGLVGMKERILMINGIFDMKSGPDTGTSISVIVNV